MESILYFIELLFCNRYMKWFTEIFSYIFKKGAFTFLVFISFIIIILILRLIYILYDREHAKKYTGTFVNYFLKYLSVFRGYHTLTNLKTMTGT